MTRIKSTMKVLSVAQGRDTRRDHAILLAQNLSIGVAQKVLYNHVRRVNETEAEEARCGN